MPVYEYACTDCGVFSALRSMHVSSEPAPCDCCGAMSPRIMSAPKLAILGKAQRHAHETNERSAHAPKVGRRSSCGCTGAHTCKTNQDGSPAKSASKVNPETGKMPLQMQTKKTARPWMLGH